MNLNIHGKPACTGPFQEAHDHGRAGGRHLGGCCAQAVQGFDDQCPHLLHPRMLRGHAGLAAEAMEISNGLRTVSLNLVKHGT